MRITYLHQYFNTPDMSGGTRSYEMAKRLVKMGHEVNIITSWREGGRAKQWSETNVDGIRVHWFPVEYSNRFSYFKRVMAFFEFIYYAARKAAQLEADVIFATSTPLTIALPGVYAAKRQKAPMVLEIRDVWPQAPIAIGALNNPLLQKVAYWLEAWSYKKSSHIVSLSPTMSEDIRKVDTQTPITEIPNNADLIRFDPKNFDRSWFKQAIPQLNGGPVVTYAGTLGFVNSVGYLVDVAKTSKDKGDDINYVIVGDGVEKDMVRNKAEAAGVLNHNFFMLDPVAKKEMPKVLAATDLSLSLVADIPQLWGNSANKFFDALASRTPIAINHPGWQAEHIENSAVGLVLPKQDPAQAASMIAEFFSDKSRVSAAGAAAGELAKQQFDIENLAKELERALTTAIQQQASKV